MLTLRHRAHVVTLLTLLIGASAGSATSSTGEQLSVEFFGLRDTAERIVFVCDRSGSVTDSMMFAKLELKRSIAALKPEQRFTVIFMSGGPPVEMAPKGFVPASQENKAKAADFIDGIVPTGPTSPGPALERALELKPEVIYVLTDGALDKKILDQVAKLNRDKAVRIHAIQFLYDSGNNLMRDLAKDNGGRFFLVTDEYLQNLVPTSKPTTKKD
jgi:ABC-type Fe3+-hydroxamate transport system substrate-binding protein